MTSAPPDDAPERANPPTGEAAIRTTASGREIEPLSASIGNIQPGGGFCLQVELAWGRFRRVWLRLVRPGYVRRMEASRRGGCQLADIDVIDQRDIKFIQNRCDFAWGHDRFAWRDRLPFARVGLAELILMVAGFTLLAVGAAAVWPPLSIGPLAVCLLVTWFFRDPERRIPDEPGAYVSPADGKIVAVETVDHDPFIGGPAIRIDIFLSIFNVHLNRSPAAGRVLGVRYRPGKFLNALRKEASRENEQLELRCEESGAPYRPFVVRQITGAIARRIVCWAAPGDEMQRGERFGMIKLGSRTELLLPADSELKIVRRVGDKVRAGATILARRDVTTGTT